MHILLLTVETAAFYARVRCDLSNLGAPIPANDVWIAALVLQQNLKLITRDSHFERVPLLVHSMNIFE